MKLENKKALIARSLGVGKERILINRERIAEVKEAITRQDIKDLVKDKAIMIKEVNGRKANEKRKTRRRQGSVRKNVSTKKRDYMTLTRKLRAYIKELKKHETIDNETYRELRKEIRARIFRSKAQLKDKLAQMEK